MFMMQPPATSLVGSLSLLETVVARLSPFISVTQLQNEFFVDASEA